tara:strand:+ start:2335 stop:2577 length:243 start_codon:yes stop_codon:yes gene_type:complete
VRYVVFGRESCPYCVDALSLLEEKHKKYNFINFEEDQAQVLQEIKNAYEWTTVPMIFEVSSGVQIKFIGGFTDLSKYLED